jgi:hypothetical protein
MFFPWAWKELQVFKVPETGYVAPFSMSFPQSLMNL